MPPKKLKDLSSSPVYSMAHGAQVELLSQALLREYMHRRGYLATLQAFDEENPRDENTISSRALMSDLMALQASDQARLKAEGIETIMEMLCNLRVEKRLLVEQLTAEANAELPEAPPAMSSSTLRKEKKTRKDNKAKTKDRRRSKEEFRDSSSDEGRTRRGGSKSKSRDGKGRVSDGVDDGSPRVTMDDLLGSSGSGSVEAEGGEDVAKAHVGAAPTWLSDAQEVQGPGSGPPAHSSDGEEDRSDDTEEDDDDDGAFDAADSAALPVEAALAACRVLCGRAPHPPLAFLRQGFTFDEELDCALIQWGRGPGAAIAVIQGLIAAFYYEKEMYVEAAVRRHDALLRALVTALTKAQPDPQHVILVSGRLSPKDPTHNVLARVKSRFRIWTTFASTAAVEERLAALLEDDEAAWRAPKGSGLFCFLLSLVLSRGSAAVEKDMDAPPHSLIHETTGAGTLELANLCLTGRAVSNRHSGTIYEGGEARKGYTSSLVCGMLSYDEDTRDAPAATASRSYTYACEPSHPSWVILHKGHFSNVFMRKDARKVFRQKRALGGSASVGLTYWDSASEDNEVDLTVTVEGTAAAAWGAQRMRNAASFVSMAITTVPEWANGTVDWGDNAPVKG